MRAEWAADSTAARWTPARSTAAGGSAPTSLPTSVAKRSALSALDASGTQSSASALTVAHRGDLAAFEEGVEVVAQLPLLTLRSFLSTKPFGKFPNGFVVRKLRSVSRWCASCHAEKKGTRCEYLVELPAEVYAATTLTDLQSTVKAW